MAIITDNQLARLYLFLRLADNRYIIETQKKRVSNSSSQSYKQYLAQQLLSKEGELPTSLQEIDHLSDILDAFVDAHGHFSLRDATRLSGLERIDSVSIPELPDPNEVFRENSTLLWFTEKGADAPLFHYMRRSRVSLACWAILVGLAPISFPLMGAYYTVYRLLDLGHRLVHDEGRLQASLITGSMVLGFSATFFTVHHFALSTFIAGAQYMGLGHPVLAAISAAIFIGLMASALIGYVATHAAKKINSYVYADALDPENPFRFRFTPRNASVPNYHDRMAMIQLREELGEWDVLQFVDRTCETPSAKLKESVVNQVRHLRTLPQQTLRIEDLGGGIMDPTTNFDAKTSEPRLVEIGQYERLTEKMTKRKDNSQQSQEGQSENNRTHTLRTHRWVAFFPSGEKRNVAFHHVPESRSRRESDESTVSHQDGWDSCGGGALSLGASGGFSSTVLPGKAWEEAGMWSSPLADNEGRAAVGGEPSPMVPTELKFV